MNKGRTEKKWKKYTKQTWIKKLLSPRLQSDIKNIPSPTSFPKLDLKNGKGLFLFGNVNTGKTLFAAHLMLEIKKQWWLESKYDKIKFVSVPKIFAQLKNSFSDDEKQEASILSEYQKVDLLILDDLGLGGKISDWFINTLYLLINHRYENMLPTIITSNKDLNELAKLFGDTRITSRIERSCKVLEKTHWKDS